MADDPLCRPLAGGTDLCVTLAAGSLPAGRFVDVWGLDELRGIAVDEHSITLGALTTYRDVQDHPVVRAELPMLVEAARLSGAAAIQNRGTLGGNIVNASPAADSPPALLAYDAELELASVRGRRWVPYRGFHRGYKQLACEPDELLTAIRMPRTPGGEGALHLYRKVGTRKAQAIAKVGLAALGRLDDGKVVHLRMALSSVGPTVLEADRAARAIVGETITEPRIEHAIGELESDLNAIDDIRSTAAYRRTVAANLVRDFLRRLAGVTGCGYGG
jgi:CO/xanthine dehydrogenase FAD-binding subunit